MKRWICLGLSFLLAAATPLSARGEEACSAKAAIVTEAVSGTALYEKNADLRLPEASTTKIMTALIALEESTLTHRITVSSKAAAVEGSQLGLTAGAELSVSDLLYVLMMKSGNDAAVALAEGICGSEEAFVERMNRRAEELGLKNTRFENPHGLPAEGHYTTARDLAELTAAALENEAFRKLVSTERTRLEYQNKVLSQITTESPVAANRGKIYDRNGNVLATNITTYRVFVSPSGIKSAQDDLEEGDTTDYAKLVSTGLSEILGVSYDEVHKQVTEYTKYLDRTIKRKVDEDTADAVREYIDEHDLQTMIYLEAQSTRYYPGGTLGAHMIGFTSSDGEGVYGLE